MDRPKSIKILKSASPKKQKQKSLQNASGFIQGWRFHPKWGFHALSNTTKGQPTLVQILRRQGRLQQVMSRLSPFQKHPERTAIGCHTHERPVVKRLETRKARLGRPKRRLLYLVFPVHRIATRRFLLNFSVGRCLTLQYCADRGIHSVRGYSSLSKHASQFG